MGYGELAPGWIAHPIIQSEDCIPQNSETSHWEILLAAAVVENIGCIGLFR